MKTLPLHIPVLLLAGLLFTGCYTKFNATSQDDKQQAEYVGEGWFEIDGAYFYIDYTTRHWYSYYGIDLATDSRFLRMAHFRHHHPTSTYFYSPFRSFYYYSYPGYANSFFYRTGLWSPRQGFFGFHPHFYSNPYMYSFYYNNWAHWRYWQTAFPNYWEGSSYAHSTSVSSGSSTSPRSSGLSSGGADTNQRNRSNQVNSRLAADGDDLFAVTSRDRINPPAVDRVTTNERQRNLRDRRDAEYRERLERNRAIRSPLSSWSSWEQRNNYGSTVHNRTRSTARSSAVNRTGTTRTSGSTAVRGSSSRSSSSGSAARSSSSNRSSGSSSSSRGSN
jgi:hypothetical protein